MLPEKLGVGPVWRATGDGAYAIPDGFYCIGFMSSGGGVVEFTSAGVALTPAVAAGAQYSAQVDSIQGGTATGVHVQLVKT